MTETGGCLDSVDGVDRLFLPVSRRVDSNDQSSDRIGVSGLILVWLIVSCRISGRTVSSDRSLGRVGSLCQSSGWIRSLGWSIQRVETPCLIPVRVNVTGRSPRRTGVSYRLSEWTGSWGRLLGVNWSIVSVTGTG